VEQSQQPVNSPGVQGGGAADPSLHSPPGLQTQLYQVWGVGWRGGWCCWGGNNWSGVQVLAWRAAQ